MVVESAAEMLTPYPEPTVCAAAPRLAWDGSSAFQSLCRVLGGLGARGTDPKGLCGSSVPGKGLCGEGETEMLPRGNRDPDCRDLGFFPWEQ